MKRTIFIALFFYCTDYFYLCLWKWRYAHANNPRRAQDNTSVSYEWNGNGLFLGSKRLTSMKVSIGLNRSIDFIDTYQNEVHNEMKRIFSLLNLRSIPKEFDERYKNPCWHRRNQKEILCLPYFFLTGIEKCGTTFLWNALSKHPEIYLEGFNKENHWWCRPRNSKNTDIVQNYILGKYRHVCAVLKNPKTPSSLIFGDGSTSLFWEFVPRFQQKLPASHRKTLTKRPYVIELVNLILPEAKYIVILRNPVARFVSAAGYFWNSLRGGRLTAGRFGDLTQNSIAQFNHCMEETSSSPLNTTSFFYYCESGEKEPGFFELIKGIYSRHLLIWWKLMPIENLLIIQAEELQTHPKDIISEVHRFLGIEKRGPSQIRGIESNKRLRRQQFKPPDHSMAALNNFYEPYNKELAEMLQDDKFLW